MIPVMANMDDLLSNDVICKALRHVRRKKGILGGEQLSGKDLPKYWKKHKRRIREQIRRGNYRPQPALKRLIDKPGKKEKRSIEVPDMMDRMLQYACYLVLAPFYEAAFCDHSFAFRPDYGGDAALMACHDYINAGYDYIVDLDIKSFFDTVQHGLMFGMLEQDVKDAALLQLMINLIKTKVIFKGKIYQKNIGLSQGSALSPLLANRFLHFFDCYLEQCKLCYVRFADDVVIFCKTEKEAEELLCMVESFLQRELCLQLNQEKTKIVRPEQLCYLGYSFQKLENGQYGFALSDLVRERMLERMRKNIQKGDFVSERWWDRMGSFNRGWINYYKHIEIGMLEFMEQAELLQTMLIRKKIEEITKEMDQCACIDALYSSKVFVLPTDWYRHCIEKNMIGN